MGENKGFMIKNVILRKYLQDFSENENIIDLNEPNRFAFFINYNIILKNFDTDFAFEAVSVDGDGDQGIDGIAIIINGRLVSSKEEFDDIRARCNSFKVSFIFIQSKTGANFDGNEIGTFFNGVEAFFNRDIKARMNQKLLDIIDFKEFIYENFNVKDELLELMLYYVLSQMRFVEQEMNLLW